MENRNSKQSIEEAYERCKSCIDEFYDRNRQIVEKVASKITIPLDPCALAQHAKNYDSKSDKYYLVLDKNGTYYICVDNTLSTRILTLPEDNIILDNTEYKQCFGEYMNVLLAYCEIILKGGSISIDSEGKYILR